MLPPAAMMISGTKLLSRAMSGSEVLLQLLSGLRSMACITIRGHRNDVC